MRNLNKLIKSKTRKKVLDRYRKINTKILYEFAISNPCFHPNVFITYPDRNTIPLGGILDDKNRYISINSHKLLNKIEDDSNKRI